MSPGAEIRRRPLSGAARRIPNFAKRCCTGSTARRQGIWNSGDTISVESSWHHRANGSVKRHVGRAVDALVSGRTRMNAAHR